MQIKKIFFAIVSVTFIFLAGCDEVDLINIEVKDDLSTNVQIVVSPIGMEPTVTSNEDLDIPLEERYFQKIKKEFESCGFDVRKNLRYDDNGVSGSQKFSSRTNLEEAFSCLSYVTNQEPLIDLGYPIKNENLFRTNYELQLGILNPSFFGYGLFFDDVKPVKEIRISLPGKITATAIEDQVPELQFNETRTEAGILILELKTIDFSDQSEKKVAESIKRILDQLNINTTGFDFSKLYSNNESEKNQAERELEKIIRGQIGIDPVNNPDEFYEYMKERIPFHTSLFITSSESKIDTNIAVTIFLGILPFFIGFLIFLYNKREKILKNWKHKPRKKSKQRTTE